MKGTSCYKQRNENYKTQHFWKLINSDLMAAGLKYTLSVFMYKGIAMLIFGINSFDGLCQG